MDYQKVGFLSGLEIHQQLDTGKLFCSCPGYLRTEEPDYLLTRRLHAVAGESGEIDAAVEHEAALKKEFVYQGYRDSTCLVEMDEEPPHMINPLALDEALKLALLMHCEIYPVAQIMRKTVIDGSNTSGFQRTVLLAHDGYIETSFGKVPIATLALEEDSARQVSKTETQTIYKLDRLGIPLIELATSPAMNNPEQVKEAALKIGEILRACKVKRGIGTIRQDLNISIKGHDRVEVKGFQDLALTKKTIDFEIERQQKDLNAGKTLGAVRGPLPDGKTEFQRPMPGKARMYPETDLPLLRIGRDHLNLLKKHLPKLKEAIRDELKKRGLSEELMLLILDGNLDEFEALIQVYSKDANLVAKMITLWRSEFSTKLKKTSQEIESVLTERVLEEVLEAVNSGKITEGDVKSVLLKIAEGAPLTSALQVEKVDHNVLEEEIAAIIREKPGLRPNAYMGLVMAKMKGKIDAKKTMEILQRLTGSL